MNNRKKIDVQLLQLGMYVAELDRPWLDSPFLFQGFLLTDTSDLQEIRGLCQYVYVDEEKSTEQRRDDGAAGTGAKQNELQVRSAGPVPMSYQRPVEEELPDAREIRAQVEAGVNELFEAARLGQAVNLPQARELIATMLVSMMRNPDALVLLSTLKGHDEAAAEHAFATSVITLNLGRHLGLDEKGLSELGMAALWHDIGETKISIDILKQPNREELASYRKHPQLGAELLSAASKIPKSVIEVALTHHEHIDGTGYPQRLSGDEITRLTKIVSIADVYDELTGGTRGRMLPSTDAIRNMYQYRGKLFDADLIEEFIASIGIYPIGSIVELQRGDVGIVISIPPDDHLHPRLLIVRDREKRPLQPPRIMNLKSFAKTSQAQNYLIERVVSPGTYDINPAGYILRELC